jgi:hypothetical protein
MFIFNKKLNLNNLILLTFLLTIALIDFFGFTTGNRFEDLQTYYHYMLNEKLIIKFERSPSTYLFRENIFIDLLLILYNIFDNQYFVILFLRLTSSLILFYILSKYNLPIYISILFFSPIFIDFLDAQIRNSLSCFLVIAGIFADKLKNKIIFIFLGCILHLASLIIVFAYFFKYLYLQQKHLKSKLFVIVIFSSILSTFYLFFLYLLDDQRLHMYWFSIEKFNFNYFIWSCMLILACLITKNYDDYFFAVSLGFIILFSVFTGAYYTRYIAIFWPLVLIELSRNSRKLYIYSVLFIYSVYSLTLNFIVV